MIERINAEVPFWFMVCLMTQQFSFHDATRSNEIPNDSIY